MEVPTPYDEVAWCGDLARHGPLKLIAWNSEARHLSVQDQSVVSGLDHASHEWGSLDVEVPLGLRSRASGTA